MFSIGSPMRVVCVTYMVAWWQRRRLRSTPFAQEVQYNFGRLDAYHFRASYLHRYIWAEIRKKIPDEHTMATKPSDFHLFCNSFQIPFYFHQTPTQTNRRNKYVYKKRNENIMYFIQIGFDARISGICGHAHIYLSIYFTFSHTRNTKKNKKKTKIIMKWVW